MKKILNLHNSRNRMILLCGVDILTIIIHSYLSLILRYELHYSWIPKEYIHSMKSYLPIGIISTLVIFMILNLYNSVWSFAGLRELTMIGVACFLSTVCQGFGMQLLVLPVPRSFHVFYFFLLLSTTVLTRFSYRIYWVLKSGLRKPQGHVYHTLVIGAGEAGSMIIQELKYSAHLNSKVVGVIDDNPHKKGKLIHGVRILGGRECILDVAKKYEVDEIILAIPSASPKVTRDILRICNQTTCKLKILPGMYQLITEDVSVSKLRDVSIEDLLGRDPIKVDLESVRGFIEGRCIMVTGGGGSIGSELCRQIAKYKPSRLIIFDIYENNACPRCGKIFPIEYIKNSDKVPLCDVCKSTVIHPGVYLHGEMLSNTVISHAVEEVAKADTILVLGMNLNSSLCKDMLPHFTGKDLIVIHKEPHYLDEKATAAYHGAVSEILPEVAESILDA